MKDADMTRIRVDGEAGGVSEDEQRVRERLEKLRDIAFGSRAGAFDGVAFDLTFQPDFKWSDWEQVGGMGWLDWTGTRSRSMWLRPYIIWPWSEQPSDVNENELRQALKSAILPNHAPDADAFEVMVKDNIAARIPDIVIRAGDEVSIGRVTLNIRERYLQAPEDVDTMHAFLTVTLVNGEKIEIAEPLKYRRIGHLNVPSEYLPVQMENRAAARANITSKMEIDELNNAWLYEGREATLAQEAFLTIHHCNNELATFLVRIRDCLPASEETEGLVLAARRMAGIFAGAGYDLAQSESDAYAVPLAEQGLRAAQSLEAATAKRREASNPIREAAWDYITANPRTTQGPCVAHVANKLSRDESTVRKVVSQMFANAEGLSGGVREKRPLTQYTMPRQTDD